MKVVVALISLALLACVHAVSSSLRSESSLNSIESQVAQLNAFGKTEEALHLVADVIHDYEAADVESESFRHLEQVWRMMESDAVDVGLSRINTLYPLSYDIYMREARDHLEAFSALQRVIDVLDIKTTLDTHSQALIQQLLEDEMDAKETAEEDFKNSQAIADTYAQQLKYYHEYVEERRVEMEASMQDLIGTLTAKIEQVEDMLTSELTHEKVEASINIVTGTLQVGLGLAMIACGAVPFGLAGIIGGVESVYGGIHELATVNPIVQEYDDQLIAISMNIGLAYKMINNAHQAEELMEVVNLDSALDQSLPQLATLSVSEDRVTFYVDFLNKELATLGPVNLKIVEYINGGQRWTEAANKWVLAASNLQTLRNNALRTEQRVAQTKSLINSNNFDALSEAIELAREHQVTVVSAFRTAMEKAIDELEYSSLVHPAPPEFSNPPAEAELTNWITSTDKWRGEILQNQNPAFYKSCWVSYTPSVSIYAEAIQNLKSNGKAIFTVPMNLDSPFYQVTVENLRVHLTFTEPISNEKPIIIKAKHGINSDIRNSTGHRRSFSHPAQEYQYEYDPVTSCPLFVESENKKFIKYSPYTEWEIILGYDVPKELISNVKFYMKLNWRLMKSTIAPFFKDDPTSHCLRAVQQC